MLAMTLALALSAAPADTTLLPSPDLPLERMSLLQLRRAQRFLDESKAPLLGPVFMVTSGGVLLGAGSYFGLLALLGAVGGPTFGNAMVCLGLLLGGSGFLGGGLYYMRVAREDRADADDRIQAIEEEIERRRAGVTVVAF
jgi:hypothetical protein